MACHMYMATKRDTVFTQYTHGALNFYHLYKIKKNPLRYETIDGTANRDEDYKHVQGVLVFEPSDTKKGITIEIIDDDDWEPDETFFCKLLW